VSEPRRYEFQGRDVTLPVMVRDASSLVATYLVRSEPARAFLPGPELELVEVLPGRTLFSIAAVKYVDNDLGAYDEVALTFFVRRRGESGWLPYLGPVVDFMRGRLATYISHMPVNQSFTRDAGEGIWGFPKTVERIEILDLGDRRSVRLEMDGRHVLTVAGGHGGTMKLPETPMRTYSYIDGILHETAFTLAATDAGFRIGSGELTLGDHPIAERLRAMGLPALPVASAWMGHQRGRFDAPVRVPL
jgi:hypothetical protein